MYPYGIKALIIEQEGKMKKVRNLIAIVAVFSIIGCFTSVQAQYAHRMTEKELKNLLQRIERDADMFRKDLDHSLDHSRLDGTQTEDNINQFMKDFAQATDRLKDRFDENNSAAGNVEEVLRRAASVDNFVITHPVNERTRQDWMRVRANLDVLAQAYNVGWTWTGVTNHPYRVSQDRVKNLLGAIEEESDHFRNSLDSALDRSRLDGTNREDDINQFVKDFEAATDQLKDRFDDRDAATGTVESVLNRAARINVFMNRHPLSVQAQNDWASLRNHLNELAQIYSVTWTW